ncbi:MAG: tetratricopeptide repeat protein [Clostridia bacterium]
MVKKHLFRKGNNIVPFEQDGSFYYRKAQKYIDSNNYINALRFYRKAVEKEPDNVEYLLDLAEIFTEMNYYEESNHILFHLIQDGANVTAECYFGLGCNFLGLQEFDKASECFDKYLQIDPDGEFSDEAQDLIDILQAQEFYFEEMDDEIDPQLNKLYKMANRGKAYLDQGEYRKAIQRLEKVLQKDFSLIFVRNNLSLAYFCNGQIEKAIEIAEGIIKEQPENIHANCNLALFYYEKKDMNKAQECYEKIMAFQGDDSDEIYKIAVTLCEMGRHVDANRVLKKLLQYKPYDKKILHYMAISYFNLRKYRKAVSIWNKIEKIDPLNTIAAYYKKQTNLVINGKIKRAMELPYHYQVPYDEILRRLKKMNDLMRMDHDEIYQVWRRDDHLKALFMWGMELNDNVIKKAIIGLIASFHDEKAEKLLRYYLLKRDESDHIKKEILAHLKQNGASEPYIAYMNGNIMEVRVNILSLDSEKVPPEYQKVLDLALKKMRNRYPEEHIKDVVLIWDRYMKALSSNLPRIYRKEGWAAALEYYYCQEKSIKITKAQLCRIYKTSAGTLNHHLRKMQEVLQNS